MALSLSSQHPLVLRENTGQQGTQDTWPGPPTLGLCQPGQATYLITLGSSSVKRKSSCLSPWFLWKVNDKVQEPEEIFKRLANNHSTLCNTAQASPSNFLLCALEARRSGPPSTSTSTCVIQSAGAPASRSLKKW